MEENLFSLNIKMCRLCPSDEFLSDLYHPSNLEVIKVINLFVSIEVRKKQNKFYPKLYLY